MKKITVSGLLKKYRNWVRKDKIQFLKQGSEDQKKILQDVEELLAIFVSAEKKANEAAEYDVSEHLDWNRTHEKGRDLWQKLASCALNNIDEVSKGNSTLFRFLKASAEFEELLYGLEDYYRDHTLHSLWVYFTGEYILRDLLPDVYQNLNWHIFNDIETYQADYRYSYRLVAFSREKERELAGKVNEKKDAIWCITALCHDLGYSFSKLEMLDGKVKEALAFLDLPNLGHMGFSLDIEQQCLVSQFLELMAADVRIVPSRNYKDQRVKLKEKVLVKCFRDDSTYWRLCRALEKKQHGILSAYLIYKVLGIFADTSMVGPAEEWGLEDVEAVDNIIRGDILFAIAQHEFDFAHLNQLNGLADILILADELEEFSRLGRPQRSRKYHDTMAHSSISVSKRRIKKEKYMDLNISYHVAPLRPLGEFFVRKARDLCRLYSLNQKEDDRGNRTKFYAINSLRMTAMKGDKEHYIHFSRDSKHKARLPEIKIEKTLYKQPEFDVECIDDEIFVHYSADQKMALREWFSHVDV